MSKQNSELVLKTLIGYIQSALDEMAADNDFDDGQKHAFVESLEIIQQWEKAEEFGLVGNLEDIYPLK